MSIKARQWILNMPEYIPGKTIDEIKKDYNLKKVYKLASNENLYDPDPGVIQEIYKNLKDIKYYPDSQCSEIRQKISEKYNININSIIIGNGTDQIIEMVCDSFIEPGRNIVISDPTFLIYEKSALKCNGKVIKVPLGKFRQDAEKLIASVNDKTKVLFLTNPHNPTGTNINYEEFDYIIKNLKNDILLVVDEAYSEYMAEEDKVDTVSYLSRYNNIVILRTFSKIYGLAGLRIGYGIADSKVISALNRIRLPFNVNFIAQKAAVKALENESYVNDIKNKIKEEKNKYYRVLAEDSIEFIKSHANFILIRTGRGSDVIVEELLKKGFIVRPGKNIGLPGYIRVTIALPDVNDIFLANFIEIFSSIMGREKA